MRLLEHCADRCRRNPKRIMFADALDASVLLAARKLKDEGLAEPVLVGSPVQVREFADRHRIATRGIRVRKPIHCPNFDSFARALYQDGIQKGLDREKAREHMRRPVYYSAMKVRHGDVDLVMAGNLTEVADVLHAALQVIGPSQKKGVVSGFSLLVAPGERQVLAFADCGVIPQPTSGQMADIAWQTAENFKKLTGQEPRVALLSFSTAGSARHPMTEKVIEALKLIGERHPSLKVDGELQFDAAIVPDIAAKKAPDSILHGSANVFIFPSLNAAHIGCKIAGSIGGYRVLGTFLQGLAKPMHLLTGAGTDEDIRQTAIMASCLVK